MNEEQRRETEKKLLKQRAMAYMPGSLETVESQRAILQMVMAAVPTVKICADKADREIWPKVKNGQMTIRNAAAACAGEVNRLIGITVLQNLKLETKPEEILLRAWIALDFYSCMVVEKYSGNLRNLQDHLTGILLHTQPQPQQSPTIRPPQEERTVMTTAEQTTEYTERTDATDYTESGYTTEGDYTSSEVMRKKRKIWILIPVAAVLVIALVLVPLLNKVWMTQWAIGAIGEVTLESAEAIEKAEERYEALTPEQQEKVDNYDVLTDARSAYDCLVTEDAIDAIGKVTMESRAAIEHAEELYNALSPSEKNTIDNHDTLAAAIKELERLDAALKKATDAIDAIGEVTLESGEKIAAAREAYDALAKDGLTSYAAGKLPTLTAAEDRFAQLQDDQKYSEALALYDKRKYDEALTMLDELLTDYSGTAAVSEVKQSRANCQIKLAEKSSNSGDQYTAMKTLKAVDPAFTGTEEYKTTLEKIQKKLQNARPTTGRVFKKTIDWGYGQVVLTAGKKDICVKIEQKGNPDKYAMAFIRAGETHTLKMKDGEYILKYASGEYWYDTEHYFGDDTYFAKTVDYLDFETERSGNWVYYHSYTINIDQNSNVFAPLTSAADF